MEKDRNKNQNKQPINQDETAQNVPPSKGALNIAKDAFSEFMDDNCTVLAAAIAYSAVQSIVPLILGFIAVVGLFLQDKAAQQSFAQGVSNAIPSEVANAIKLNDIITNFASSAGAVSIISILLFLWSGSGMFGQIKFCVNIAFDVEKDKRNPILGIGLQLFMLVVLGGLLIAASLVGIVIGLILHLQLFGLSLGGISWLVQILSYLIPFVLETLVFASIYKISPARKGVRWKPVLIAGAFAALLFEIIKVFMGIYVNVFGAASSATKTYGAIGGIFVFLFFLYLLGIIILFGAELAAVLHNFKSGYAAADTKEAVVQVKTQKEGNLLVPKSSSRKPVSGFDYGTVEMDPVIIAAQDRLKNHPNYVTTASSITPVKPNPVTTFIGGAVLIIAAAISFLTRRKSQA